MTFDFIAACLIFAGKSQAFVDSVMAQYTESSAKEKGLRNSDDEEKIHLGILGGYFNQMGLSKDRLSDTDMEFFDSFSLKTRSA